MSAFQSPRPTPRFFQELQTFSTKKSRGTPRDSLPPKPPVKSAPPVSRIFPHRPVTRAQLVSFRSTTSQDSILSPGYNQHSRESYFSQCFQIISQLGVGSFGEVYQVRSKEDGKLYAVKKSRDRFRGESDRRRKLEEVAKQEKLPSHPNCVRIYRAWEERLTLYLLVELCKTSLSNYAETHHDIPESVIWDYLVDLLQAVKHLHDNNLVHMDIKPDNIFISQDGICKLGDFGLVIDLSKGNDFSEAQEGDPKYLSPELMNGKFGKPADIFSLGITILELASDLDLPRGGDGWHILRHGHMPDEFLRDKSFDLKYVIGQMLDPDPRCRPTADQCLAFPYVRKVLKRRRRDYMLKSAVATVKSSLHTLWAWFLAMFTLLTLPVQRLRYRFGKRRSSITSGTGSDTSHLDHSLSDDELFCNDVSITNNSIGAPLESSSSENSIMDPSPFKPPMRNAFTTPALRNRHYSHIPSPISSSPVAHGSRATPGHSASPVHNTREDSLDTSSLSWSDDDRPVTPTVGQAEDTPVNKSTIEPKNLMGMFDAASDEEC
ncbi:membrane-associated tyrosine- and threonine-specific cdc2-inhibitory kinase-like [Mya arenaria]|uniref:membrane-associated tyrosine- and threonine-specific cdc2-inhibitory kinase-like n=1 Tax=Mya arenaria TaxID=6604 RepID=UPI0022E410C8|nr:membrane-associated tyrosine- and threonine-specific cdc2-inhibitory kinase-like [Mya arenaria]XP_052798761.1 membrane-associated tyrosine- and threonine-specific cdc2-inhibitory kinase-like [Mya arenaria]